MIARCCLLAACLLASACSQAPRSTTPAGLFREAAAETGLTFHHFNGATGQYYFPEVVGPGVAVFDYDGDGDLDVFLVQGDLIVPGPMEKALFPPPAGWTKGSKLFRNELIPSGKLRFADVTAVAGIHFTALGMGAAVADYDNDGHPDLLVTGLRGNALYHNKGDGSFEEVTAAAGVADSGWSTSAAFTDYDHDGRLDLFLTHYVELAIKERQCQNSEAVADYCGPQSFRPTPSRLFHNEGNGRFRDVSAASGIASKPGPGLGVVGADLNGDSLPDFYVANDGAASHYWVNQGKGIFRESGAESGVAYDMHGKAQAGMGIAVGDFDADGDEDLFKTNLTREGANLYLNDGKGFFTDSATQFGLFNTTFLFTGFGTGWFDYDNDGWLDLAVVNGAVNIVEAQRGQPFPYRQPNQLFHNEEGRSFKEVTKMAGEAFQKQEVSRSVAFGDLDNDGRVDLVIANNNGPTRLYLNQDPSGGHWLMVKLQGGKSNRDGAGAFVTVKRNSGAALRRRAHSDGSYLAASDIRVHFGLGSSTRGTGLRWSGRMVPGKSLRSRAWTGW